MTIEEILFNHEADKIHIHIDDEAKKELFELVEEGYHFEENTVKAGFLLPILIKDGKHDQGKYIFVNNLPTYVDENGTLRKLSEEEETKVLAMTGTMNPAYSKNFYSYIVDELMKAGYEDEALRLSLFLI